MYDLRAVLERMQIEGIDFKDLQARNYQVTKTELAQIVHRTQAATEAKKALQKVLSFQPHGDVYKKIEEAIKVIDSLIIARAMLKIVQDPDDEVIF